MGLELIETASIRDGYKRLGDRVFSVRQNLNAKVKTPTIKEINLWKDTWLDAREQKVAGGEKDGRNVFKIDHNFDLNIIINKYDSVLSINEDIYNKSQGNEFVIIHNSDIKGTNISYSISAKKYESVKDKLNKKKIEVIELEKAGGFKLDEELTPKEVETHEGWLEFAVGKNNASEIDYLEASDFLKKKYIPKAITNGCFTNGRGMAFLININENYTVRPFDMGQFEKSTYVNYFGDFSIDGRFLRSVPENTVDIFTILKEEARLSDFTLGQAKRLKKVLEDKEYVIIKR